MLACGVLVYGHDVRTEIAYAATRGGRYSAGMPLLVCGYAAARSTIDPAPLLLRVAPQPFWHKRCARLLGLQTHIHTTTELRGASTDGRCTARGTRVCC
eukprot:1228290-Rhodomonas_salina.2